MSFDLGIWNAMSDGQRIQECAKLSMEIESLRSRLAEADALLTEIAGHRPAVAFFAPQLAGVIGTLNRIDAYLAREAKP
jgi:hypothetical protein